MPMSLSKYAKLAAAALLGASVLTPASADVLYQSASPDTYSTSYTTNAAQLYGQVITLSQALTIDSIGARFSGGKASFGSIVANGSIFGAIVALNSSNSTSGLPSFSPAGLTTSDVLADATFSTAYLAQGQTALIDSNVIGGPVTLQAGTYMILFGAGGSLGTALGATGEANITIGNYAAGDVTTADGITQYHVGTTNYNDVTYANGSWKTGPSANILMQLNGSVAAVPEASTWAMMILGFATIGFETRRRKRSAALKLA